MNQVRVEVEWTGRQKYIDVAKGILIICVIIGQIVNFNYFFTGAMKTIIYSFHMPAFFIISGMLMRKEKIENQSLRVIIVKRMMRLMIPYVTFEIVGGLLQIFLFGTDAVNLRGILYGILTIHCHVGADWFLPTLFFAEVIFYLSAKKLNKSKLIIVGFCCFVVSMVSLEWNYLIVVARRTLVAFSFIVTGYVGRKYFAFKSKVGVVISGIVLVIFSYVNGTVDLSARIFHDPLLYFLTGITGTYLLLDFSQFVHGKVEMLFCKVGRESLLIMGTHQHVMLIANYFVGSVYTLSTQCVLLFVTLIYEIILSNLVKGFEKFACKNMKMSVFQRKLKL